MGKRISVTVQINVDEMADLRIQLQQAADYLPARIGALLDAQATFKGLVELPYGNLDLPTGKITGPADANGPTYRISINQY